MSQIREIYIVKLTALLKTGNDGTKLCFWTVRIPYKSRIKKQIGGWGGKKKKNLKIPLFNTMNVPCSLAQICPKQDKQVRIM